MKVIKILNKKYVDEINKNMYLNKPKKTDNDESEHNNQLDEDTKERQRLNYYYLSNQMLNKNNLSDIYKKYTSELKNNETRTNKTKIKKRFKFESDKYQSNQSLDSSNFEDFRIKITTEKGSRKFNSRGISGNLLLPKLNYKNISPENIFPKENIKGFAIRDIVGIENLIMKPFKF